MLRNIQFLKIRHYGILSGAKKAQLHDIRTDFGLFENDGEIFKRWSEISKSKLNYDPQLCPKCGHLGMFYVGHWFQGKDPPECLKPYINKTKI